jgi:hypothetical protein
MDFKDFGEHLFKKEFNKYMEIETFEQFLMEKHCEENPQLLKDILVDDFDDWVSGLGADDMIKYADQFLKSSLQEQREAIEKEFTDKLIKLLAESESLETTKEIRTRIKDLII